MGDNNGISELNNIDPAVELESSMKEEFIKQQTLNKKNREEKYEPKKRIDNKRNRLPTGKGDSPFFPRDVDGARTGSNEFDRNTKRFNKENKE